MLAQSLRQVRSWNDQGLRLRCAVNLPPSFVTDLSFPDRVAALLAENGVDGSQLALEITETATMQNPTGAMDDPDAPAREAHRAVARRFRHGVSPR